MRQLCLPRMWQPKPTLGWQIQVAAGSQQSVGWTLSGRRLTTPPHVRSSKGVGFAMGGGHPPTWTMAQSGCLILARPEAPGRKKLANQIGIKFLFGHFFGKILSNFSVQKRWKEKTGGGSWVNPRGWPPWKVGVAQTHPARSGGNPHSSTVHHP